MSPLHPAPFLVQKALKTVESEESVFCVGLQVGCPSLQIRRFSVESGLQTTTLLSFPLSGRKSGEFQPAKHVTACHRFVTAQKRLVKPAPRLRWVCKSWLILPVVICLSQSRS